MQKKAKVPGKDKQHFVAQSYMKPWCDPNIPAGAKVAPYVWVFNRDGSNARRKSPSNLFHENNIYTIRLPDGDRDLRLENGFQQLEDTFTRIRNKRLQKRVDLNAEEIGWLLAFVATAQARTQAFRNHRRPPGFSSTQL